MLLSSADLFVYSSSASASPVVPEILPVGDEAASRLRTL